MPARSLILANVSMEKDDIVAFAQAYDPQSFHIDETAAADSIYGGLIASGWHTACAFMSLLAKNLLVDSASMGLVGARRATLDSARSAWRPSGGDNQSH